MNQNIISRKLSYKKKEKGMHMKKVLSIILFFVISSTYVLQAQWSIYSNQGMGK